MLVLTRKVGESIVLPELDIEFTVLEMRGGRVRVGIQAPAAVEIQRKELLEGEQQGFQQRPRRRPAAHALTND